SAARGGPTHESRSSWVRRTHEPPQRRAQERQDSTRSWHALLAEFLSGRRAWRKDRLQPTYARPASIPVGRALIFARGNTHVVSANRPRWTPPRTVRPAIRAPLTSIAGVSRQREARGT